MLGVFKIISLVLLVIAFSKSFGSNLNWFSSFSFTVTALQAQLAETIANHQVLASLAAKTGGEFYTGTTIKDIAKSIKSRADIKAVSYEQKRLDDVINLKWIFGLIMLLLSLEWFFRKRSGSY